MKVIGTLSKPGLKMVKLGDVERPMIEFKVSVPYTDEEWAFVGKQAGNSLNVLLTPSQREMFDEETGEIRTARR